MKRGIKKNKIKTNQQLSTAGIVEIPFPNFGSVVQIFFVFHYYF